MTVTVRTKKELEATIKDYRNKGYMLITLGKKMAELENDSEMIVVEVKK